MKKTKFTTKKHNPYYKIVTTDIDDSIYLKEYSVGEEAKNYIAEEKYY